jgi:hypothetical protein
MTRPADDAKGAWHRLDAAAFGLLYGTIASLSVLMTMEAHPDHPLRMALALFGSVLAITLAKAFAEVMAGGLNSMHEAGPVSFVAAWRHARPTLVAANGPTLLLAAAGIGLLPSELAITLAQVFGIAVLAILGGRVGWVARGTLRAVVLAGLFTGAIGLALSVMKYLLH